MLDSDINEKSTNNSRPERTRKLPKRWDNDELEVDPTVKAAITNSNNDIVNHAFSDSEEDVDDEEDPENFDDDDYDDEYDGDEDDDAVNDDTIYCTCRQKYNFRFMIFCDCCLQWYHGKCEGVTKAEGKKLELDGKEWFCKFCRDGMKDNKTNDELKILSARNLEKLEEEKELRRKMKEEQRKLLNSKSTQSFNGDTKIENSIRNNDDNDKNKFKSRLISKEQQRAMKEKEEEQKLKKLIKSKKQSIKKSVDLHNQSNINKKNSIKDQLLTNDIDLSNSSSSSYQTNNIDEFSKIVSSNKNSKESYKKKNKSNSLDCSVQDLFKAEPVLNRSHSSSSSSSITTPTEEESSSINDQIQKRNNNVNGSLIESNSGSNSQQIECPNCGVIKNWTPDKADPQSYINSIYCNDNCLKKHVIKSQMNCKFVKDSKNDSIKRYEIEDLLNDVSINDSFTDLDVLQYIRKYPSLKIKAIRPFKELPTKKPKSLSKPVQQQQQQLQSSNKSQYHNQNKTSISVKQLSSNEKSTNSDSSKEKRKSSSSTALTSPTKIERSSSISSTSTSTSPDIEDKRKYVRNSIDDILNSRFNELSMEEKQKLQNEKDEISKLSKKIEDELFKIFKCNNMKYKNKYRSLLFNLKDRKNNLYREVLLGNITPERLVNMSAEELANQELARWREHEKKAMITLITANAVDQANQIIVKKTHKGEELIENDLIKELPTTMPPDLVSLTESTSDLQKDKNKQKEMDLIHGIRNLKESSLFSTELSKQDDGSHSMMFDLLDTTSEHESHTFSDNCKICNKSKFEDTSMKNDSVKINNLNNLITPNSPNKTSNKREKEKDLLNQSQQRSQPKRVRVELESTNEFLKQINDKFSKENQQNLSDIFSKDDDDKKIVNENKDEIDKDVHNQSNGHSPHQHESSTQIIVWRGTIEYCENPKFVATAQLIYGSYDKNFFKELRNPLKIVGRMSTKDALNHINKLLSCSRRHEIILLKFEWLNEDYRDNYEEFLNYLHYRNRFGVVKCPSKAPFRDFYLMPLLHDADVPEFLLNKNGEELKLEKKSHRPDLFLGIIVKQAKQSSSLLLSSNKHNPIESPSNQRRSPNSPENERSYTPPLSMNNNDDGSFTPPLSLRQKSSITSIKSNVHPYGINDLINDVASNENLRNKAPSIIEAITENLQEREQLLSTVKARFESTPISSLPFRSHQSHHTIASNSDLKNLPLSDDIMKNIVLPPNLASILDNIKFSSTLTPSLPISTPQNSANIISNNVSYNDPRLRMMQSSTQPVTNAVAAMMPQDELLEKGLKQMEALKRMEQQQQSMLHEKPPMFVMGIPPPSSATTSSLSSLSSPAIRHINNNKRNYEDDAETGSKICFKFFKKKYR